MAAGAGDVCLLVIRIPDAVAARLQGERARDCEISVQFIEALPYLLTVILLAGFIGRALAPGQRHPLYEGAITDRGRPHDRHVARECSAPRILTTWARCVRQTGRLQAATRNAAYPEGTCAEAGAIAAMVMAGHKQSKCWDWPCRSPCTPCVVVDETA